MEWPGRRMSTGRPTSWEVLRDMGFLLLRKKHRSEGSAETWSVRAVGRCRGEIGGGRSSKDSGDAADVVCLQWFGLRCVVNLVIQERPQLCLRIGIECLSACSCWRRGGLHIRNSKRRWRRSERAGLERLESGS